MGPETQIDAERWVNEHGDVLFRYAISRVPDREVAEDIVQEAFLAALRARASFAGQSSERTWLIGILKRKVFDHYRKHYRERSVIDTEADHQEDPFTEDLFDRREHWKQSPSMWFHPRAALQEKEFWNVLRQCIDGLPKRMTDAFTLRVLEELTTEEVCNIMDVTPTNLGATLHRARMRLRLCLDKNWFHRSSTKKER